jgi:alanine racemase
MKNLTQSKLGIRTWIEIDTRSLFFNLRQFERRARPAKIMAVVKSNAYGHGLWRGGKHHAHKDSRFTIQVYGLAWIR